MERDWYSVNVFFKMYYVWRNGRVLSTWAKKYASNNGWPLSLSHSKIKYHAKLAGRRKIYILCGVWCSNRLRLAHWSSVDDGVYMLYYPCGRNLDRSQVSFIWASFLPYILGLLLLCMVVYYLLRYTSKFVQWHSVINFSCRNNFPCMPEERHFGSKIVYILRSTTHWHTVNVDYRWIPASTWYTAIHNSGVDSGVDEHAMVCMRHCIPDTHIIHISGLHESMWTKFLFCRRKNLMLHPWRVTWPVD